MADTKKVQEELEHDKAAMAEVLKTPAGRRVFRKMQAICGYHLAERVIRSDGQVDTVVTALNVERRLVCIELRALASKADLKAVDYPEEN